MTTIVCDICGCKIPYGVIKVTVNNGEHPHSGSVMTKNIDCCADCITKIPKLRSYIEYDELRKRVNVRRLS